MRTSESPTFVQPSLEAKGLSKHFGAIPAVNDVSFSLFPGSITALVGPNGAGKSTLIALLLGIAHPTAGRAMIGGVSALSPRARQLRAFALQDSFFPYLLSPRECLRFIGTCYRQPDAGAQAPALLTARELSARRLRAMSGGQRRKVLIAAALEAPPDVLVLDEPTAMLDTDSKRAFWQRVVELRDKGKTIFFTSHNLDEVERQADRILLMSGGRLAHDGTLASISTLTSESTLRFSTSVTEQASNVLRAHGIVARVEGETWEFASANPEKVLADLFACGVPLRGLTVQKPSLQECLHNADLLKDSA